MQTLLKRWYNFRPHSFLPQKIHSGSETHSASYTMSTGVLSGDKATTTCRWLQTSIYYRGSERVELYLYSPYYAFTEWRGGSLPSTFLGSIKKPGNLFTRSTTISLSTTLLHGVRYTHRLTYVFVFLFPRYENTQFFILRKITALQTPDWKISCKDIFYSELWPSRFEFLQMTHVSGHINIRSISGQMQEHIPNRKRSTFRPMLFPFAFVITRL